jgi:hypothetical protein
MFIILFTFLAIISVKGLVITYPDSASVWKYGESYALSIRQVLIISHPSEQEVEKIECHGP